MWYSMVYVWSVCSNHWSVTTKDLLVVTDPYVLYYHMYTGCHLMYVVMVSLGHGNVTTTTVSVRVHYCSIARGHFTLLGTLAPGNPTKFFSQFRILTNPPTQFWTWFPGPIATQFARPVSHC